jgi:hypothetical protein
MDMVCTVGRFRGRYDVGSLFERKLQVHSLRAGGERLVCLLDRRPGGSSLRVGRLRLRSLYLPGRHGDVVEQRGDRIEQRLRWFGGRLEQRLREQFGNQLGE